MRPLESDLGVYVLAGAFAVLVFAVAMTLLVVLAPVDLGRGTLATFTVGFGLFMAVYFTAMAVYRGIDDREPL
jgi:hypothetical protein